MATKPKFHFNPETLSFEKVETSLAHISKKIFLHLFSGIFMGFLFFLIFVSLIDSPEEKQLQKENKALEIQYKLLDKQITELQEVMDNLKQRDNNLYRVIFQADPINDDIRHANANSKRYEELSNMTGSKILVNTTYMIDDLSKQIYTQSKSFDELVDLVKTNETKLQNIPGIQPVLNKDLTRVASGYGRRIDPVYRTPKMHYGMDFTAPIGTDIYATGNGTVTFAGWKQGYGNTLIINHGFGYETMYAHCSKLYAKVGQKVTRGEIVAAVGNTGKSTGPHLHYEVHFKDKPTNPMNYYFLDLSPEEYDMMIQLAANSGQVMD